MNGKQVALTLMVVSVLLLWIIATSSVFALLDLRSTAPVGWALVGAVAVTALARPFRHATAVATAVAVILYLSSHIYRILSIPGAVLEIRPLLIALPGALALIVTGLLSASTAGRFARIRTQVEQDAAVIEQLTRHDEVTGVLKESYAHRLLTQEVERARRYHRPLSVVLLGTDDWSVVVRERGRESARETLAAAGKLLVERLRTVDIVSRHDDGQFILVLPETPAEGGQLVAERLCTAIAETTAVQFKAGVAEFPTDGVSREELLAEAEAALTFARDAGITAASHSILG